MSAAQAIVERSEVADTAASIIQVIERAASNPNVDIDKMERLLQMQERILDRNAKAAYSAALADMQPKLPVVVERGEIKHGDNKPVQSRYALWEDINEAIRPLLAQHGFALSFRTGRDGDRIIVTGVLSHRDGHSEQTSMPLPADQSGSKNAVQAVGSSVSYGKRYTALALLNITTRGEDDDGKAAGIGDIISDEQFNILSALIDETKSDIGRFCAAFKIDALPDLPASKFQQAIDLLNQKKNGARK